MLNKKIENIQLKIRKIQFLQKPIGNNIPHQKKCLI